MLVGSEIWKYGHTWTLARVHNDEAREVSTPWIRVALNCLCSEYVEHIKLTQKDLYKYIVENPTYEESRRNVGELAKIFLANLKKDQEAIAEKEFEAQKKIKALKQD